MGYLRYKGYTGRVDYSEEDNCFCGVVTGLHRDGILFEGNTVDEVKKDFEESIEDYLASCEERGVEPEKPYSGKLVLRIQPSLHGEAAERAADCGISLNEFISRAIQAALR